MNDSHDKIYRELKDWLKPVHIFSVEEEKQLSHIYERVISEAKRKDGELTAKLNACWIDLLKIVAVHIATKPDQDVSDSDLRKWLDDLKLCLLELRRLLDPAGIGKHGVWLLELHHGLQVSPNKDLAESNVMQFQVAKLFGALSSSAVIVISMVSNLLALMPRTGGRPKRIDRQLLSDGVVMVLHSRGVEISSAEESIAVFVVDEIYRTFAGANIGTSRANVLESKKKLKSNS